MLIGKLTRLYINFNHVAAITRGQERAGEKVSGASFLSSLRVPKGEEMQECVYPNITSIASISRVLYIVGHQLPRCSNYVTFLSSNRVYSELVH